MQKRNYADTDFFLALMKDSDWLKKKAIKVYNERKDNIWVSPFTIAEVMIICKREDIPLKETILQISRISKLENFSWNDFFRACDYVEKGATIFDSLLMAIVKDNKIISSDRVYEKFGFKIISLRKK
ncbi:MAG: PIN domain-containing protein [Candidatus Pacearchaeota archaeon]|jgi:PIN domain nuclease of toxin-antitoxin system